MTTMMVMMMVMVMMMFLFPSFRPDKLFGSFHLFSPPLFLQSVIVAVLVVVVPFVVVFPKVTVVVFFVGDEAVFPVVEEVSTMQRQRRRWIRDD